MTSHENPSSELIILANLAIKPDALDAFTQAARDAALETRREAGCLRYEVHADAKHPEKIVISERWTDEAALNEHLKMPYAKAFIASLGQFLAAPPTIMRLAPLKF
ncbi:putative quinol monooxygenase [Aliidongia dinghuensis]|nr:putative quinol monooxygenase [Aliidongia dinghuensis]